jgi:hypothetical protein
MLRKKNNLENLQLLAEQIENDREKKQRKKEMEQLYKKPHFGPEETDLTLAIESRRQRLLKNKVRTDLFNQIHTNATFNMNRFEKEKMGDLENI